MLDQILFGSLAELLRLRGDLESGMGRKGLTVNLAALAEKTGHSGRDQVGRVFERWASKTQHQVGGSGEVLKGQISEAGSKSRHFWQGGNLFVSTCVSNCTYYEEAEEGILTQDRMEKSLLKNRPRGSNQCAGLTLRSYRM